MGMRSCLFLSFWVLTYPCVTWRRYLKVPAKEGRPLKPKAVQGLSFDLRRTTEPTLLKATLKASLPQNAFGMTQGFYPWFYVDFLCWLLNFLCILICMCLKSPGNRNSKLDCDGWGTGGVLPPAPSGWPIQLSQRRLRLGNRNNNNYLLLMWVNRLLLLLLFVSPEQRESREGMWCKKLPMSHHVS